jgi:hypothetical protein
MEIFDGVIHGGRLADLRTAVNFEEVIDLVALLAQPVVRQTGGALAEAERRWVVEIFHYLLSRALIKDCNTSCVEWFLLETSVVIDSSSLVL